MMAKKNIYVYGSKTTTCYTETIRCDRVLTTQIMQKNNTIIETTQIHIRSKHDNITKIHILRIGRKKKKIQTVVHQASENCETPYLSAALHKSYKLKIKPRSDANVGIRDLKNQYVIFVFRIPVRLIICIFSLVVNHYI